MTGKDSGLNKEEQNWVVLFKQADERFDGFSEKQRQEQLKKIKQANVRREKRQQDLEVNIRFLASELDIEIKALLSGFAAVRFSKPAALSGPNIYRNSIRWSVYYPNWDPDAREFPEYWNVSVTLEVGAVGGDRFVIEGVGNAPRECLAETGALFRALQYAKPVKQGSKG